MALIPWCDYIRGNPNSIKKREERREKREFSIEQREDKCSQLY